MSEPTQNNSPAAAPLYACSCCGALAAPRYVSPTGFASASGELALVTPDTPLPVMIINSSGGPSAMPQPQQRTPVPLTGTAAKSAIIGPFIPSVDLPVYLHLSGDWKGTVALERSTDAGKTRHGLTIGGYPWASYTSNVNEPVWQEVDPQASLWLNIAIVSGNLTYRLS